MEDQKMNHFNKAPYWRTMPKKRDNSVSIDLTGKLAYNASMLKQYRLKLNISQEQLADEIGISIRTVRNLEAGKDSSNLVRQAIETWLKEVAYQERVATKSIQGKQK